MTPHSVPMIHQDPSLLMSRVSDATEQSLLFTHIILVGNPVEMFCLSLSLDLCLHAVPSPRSGGSSSGLDGGRQGGAVVGLFSAEFACFASVCGTPSREYSGFLPQSKDNSCWTRVLMQTYSENAECFSVEMTPLPAQRQWC